MTPTKREFWGVLRRKTKQKRQPRIESATVVALTLQGKPIIAFMGTILPSKKTYPHMKHYTPAVGDRVLLIDGIIIGGWRA